MLARYKSLEEQLKLLQIDPDAVKPDNLVSTIKLTSPINGYITKSEAVRGMFVDPSDILCEIIDPSHLHVELKVFEKDISRLRKGQSIDFRIPEASGESCRGEVVLIGREIEGDERTVTVHGHITRRTGMNLTPGMYVEAVINTDPGRVEGLPAEAFVNQEGRSYVYVKESERKDEILFRMIPVRTGKSTEEWSEIYDSTGVLHRAAGSILIKGAYYLAPE
jgi:cobalt-zinc-cadmium efflux system membrane fusion protein